MLLRRASVAPSARFGASRTYKCVVVSSRIFRNDPAVKPMLQQNLLKLHDAAMRQPGFVSATGYSLSKWNLPVTRRNLDIATLPNSVILSTWRGELDWEEWFTSELRTQIAAEVGDYLVEPEKHLVLSENQQQVFLL